MTQLRTEAIIIADSIAPSGIRLTTALVRFATMVLQDAHTHRTVYQFVKPDGDTEWADLVSNKSTNSNRAKTTKQVIYEVWKYPYCPERFPARSASMHSSRGYLEGWKHTVARRLWLLGRYPMILLALLLMSIPGVHKQVANRVLMAWTWTVMVMTAVKPYWDHFINLRADIHAQDQMQDLANAFNIAWQQSTPRQLIEGEWHLPFITDVESVSYSDVTLLRVSAARCAGTSYAATLADLEASTRNRGVTADLEMFNTRLANMKPPHDGPREHQGRAHSDPNHRSGTLFGWDQLRHTDMNKHLDLLAQVPMPPRFERPQGTWEVPTLPKR